MSNIKYSVKGIDLFDLTLVTTEAVGFEKEFMLDRKLATYWKANTTADQYVEIDLVSNLKVDHLLLHWNPGGSFTYTIYADTNSDYSTEQQIDSGSSSGGDVWTTSVYDFTETSSYRYWRIKFSNLSTQVKVATIFIGSFYEITVRYNYDDIDNEIDYSGVDLVESYGGQRNVPYEKPARGYWEFTYEYLDPSNLNNINSVMAYSQGKRYPIWFCDTGGTWRYVRIKNNNIRARQVADDLYNTEPILLEEELNV